MHGHCIKTVKCGLHIIFYTIIAYIYAYFCMKLFVYIYDYSVRIFSMSVGFSAAFTLSMAFTITPFSSMR